LGIGAAGRAALERSTMLLLPGIELKAENRKLETLDR
jgi:hypothetical protein